MYRVHYYTSKTFSNAAAATLEDRKQRSKMEMKLANAVIWLMFHLYKATLILIGSIVVVTILATVIAEIFHG